MASGKKTLRTKLALILGSTLAALTLAEVAARAYFPGADSFYMYPPLIERTFLPTVKILPGIGERAHFNVNSMGLRGDEPPEGEAYRILAVGGSTTQCAYIDQPDTWPMRVQTTLSATSDGLPVWVGNAGRSGFTSRRHVVQLKYLLEFGPKYDAVILLAGVNDLANRLEFGDEQPPAEDLTFEGIKVASCFTFVPTEFDDLNTTFKSLGLFRMAKAIKIRANMPPQEKVGKNYKKWRRNRRTASELRDELPDLEPALAAYRANLAECARIAAEHDTRLILVDQPTIWRDDLPTPLHQALWLGGIGDYQHEEGLPYYSISALARAMDLYNETLHAFAAEAGIESIRLADAIPKDPLHFYDDVHYNNQGSRKVGDVIAAFMKATAPFAN